VRYIVYARPRGLDSWGSGAYDAPRGSRRHKGIDYEAPSGAQCLPCTPGKVTKLGYPYADDLTYRYVEVTDREGFRCRYFYVASGLHLGQEVTIHTPLGIIQDITRRYEGITNHVHFEVIAPDGNWVDPEEYYSGVANFDGVD